MGSYSKGNKKCKRIVYILNLSIRFFAYPLKFLKTLSQLDWIIEEEQYIKWLSTGPFYLTHTAIFLK